MPNRIPKFLVTALMLLQWDWGMERGGRGRVAEEWYDGRKW